MCATGSVLKCLMLGMVQRLEILSSNSASKLELEFSSRPTERIIDINLRHRDLASVARIDQL